MLSQGSNPEAIQPHLASVFDSIELIEFDRAEPTKVVAFKSGIGEGLPLLRDSLFCILLGFLFLS